MRKEIEARFTKFEIARIIGARALQIAMDAPILLQISKEELDEMNYDALKIAQGELEEGALPIAVHRPVPRRGHDKLREIKEDEISDKELIEKEKEEEKEIAESADELGFVNPEDSDDVVTDDSTSEEQ